MNLNLLIRRHTIFFLSTVLLCVTSSYSQSSMVFDTFHEMEDAEQRFVYFFQVKDKYKETTPEWWLNATDGYINTLNKGEASGRSKEVNFYRIIKAQILLDQRQYENSLREATDIYQKKPELTNLQLSKLMGVMDKTYKALHLYGNQLELRKEMKALFGTEPRLYDIYSNLGQHRDARKNYIQAHSGVLDNGTNLEKAMYHNDIGKFLLKEKLTFNAEHNFTVASSHIQLFLSQNRVDDANYREGLYLEGMINGNLGQAKIDQENYLEAVPLLEFAVDRIQIYDEGAYQEELIDYWKALVKVNIKLKHLNKAKLYLDRISAYSGNSYDYDRLLADYYLSKGVTDSAFYHYRKFINVKDSVFEAQRNNQLMGLVVISDLENQRQMSERLEEDIRKTNELVEERDRKLNLGMIALFFSLIGFGGVAYAYAKKIKSQKLIEHQSKIIEESLREKESLLKEIHHRVKNNLQMVSSLLNLQSKNAINDEVLYALQEGRNRVKAMALIHQKLYQTEGLSVIEMRGYIDSLAKSIESVYKKPDEDVEILINADNIELDIDSAIPIGLILNELVSNSYKYAFDGVAHPEIHIKIIKTDSGYDFDYRDNGLGIPRDLDVKKSKSLGLRLVKRLTNQLRSELNFENTGKGSRFWFNFT